MSSIIFGLSEKYVFDNIASDIANITPPENIMIKNVFLNPWRMHKDKPVALKDIKIIRYAIAINLNLPKCNPKNFSNRKTDAPNRTDPTTGMMIYKCCPAT